MLPLPCELLDDTGRQLAQVIVIHYINYADDDSAAFVGATDVDDDGGVAAAASDDDEYDE